MLGVPGPQPDQEVADLRRPPEGELTPRRERVDRAGHVAVERVHLRRTRLDVVVDTSVYTAKSFNAVRDALLEAVVITGLILLLFLHTWRSTVIVLVSIPVSILVTLVLMNALDFNLNLLTMVALTVSVGFLVDDSIVVLESIHRHLDRGKPPLQAALDGRGEIGLAAIPITFVDVVVYLPLAVLTTGIPRQFIGPFAVVITIATLASLAVSFTLTPLLAARTLHGGHQGAGAGPSARLGRVWDGGFARLQHDYAWLLRRALPRRWLVIAVGLATFAGGLSLPFLGFVGYDFFPAGDQSEVDVNPTMPAATSLAATDAVARQIEADLRSRSEVRSVYTVVGAAQNSGRRAAANDANQAQIPTRIQRIDRSRAITVGVNAGRGALVGDVQGAIERRVGAIPLPTGYRVAYGGQGENGGQAVGDMVRAMGVGVLLMSMLLMMLFGSLTLPLAVLMSLPLAVVGALGGLALTHNPFTLFSLLGVAVLIGLVGKNAILLVDLTDRLRAQGDDRFTALVTAGPTRLRPIVMTTISVQAALLPIASGLEEGSELLQSVAVVLIGGLLTSTLLTLVFVPAMYTVFDDVECGLRWLLGWRTAPLAPSPNGRAQLDGVGAASERPEQRPLPAAPARG